MSSALAGTPAVSQQTLGGGRGQGREDTEQGRGGRGKSGQATNERDTVKHNTKRPVQEWMVTSVQARIGECGEGLWCAMPPLSPRPTPSSLVPRISLWLSLYMSFNSAFFGRVGYGVGTESGCSASTIAVFHLSSVSTKTHFLFLVGLPASFLSSAPSLWWRAWQDGGRPHVGALSLTVALIPSRLEQVGVLKELHCNERMCRTDINSRV